MAPFSDSARFVDPTNFSHSFINYYPFGAAIALALDLEMRARSKGHLSLDDYMRTMWRVHGKPGGSQPGLVARPYDPRMRATAWPRRWTIVSSPLISSRATSKDVKCPITHGCCTAGVLVRKRSAGVGWTGASIGGIGKSDRARRLGNSRICRRPRRR